MKTFNRQCPNCQKKLNYCNESNCNKAKKCDSLCSSCACKKRIQTYGIDESFIANHTKGCFIGNKNPFYGKAHTKEAKKKMSENTDKSFMQTDAYKEKVSKQTNQIIVEIKPMRLWNSPIVKLKTLAAISYCQTHDLIYKLVDQKPIDNDCIKKLRNTCEIKFIDRYEKLFQQKYL
jgi:hypothetical protein